MLAVPQWTEGEFTVLAPQSSDLIANRVAEGPLSLLGGNVASANLDLTPAGATFMVKSLVGEDGGSGADLTPLQVRYDLKMMVRMPPATVRVEADWRRVYQEFHQMKHEFNSSCGEDDFETSEQSIRMACESGLIKTTVDLGQLSVSDGLAKELTTMAQKIAGDLIKEKFFKREPRPAPPDDKAKDYTDREEDIYVFRSEQEIDFSSFRQEFTIDSALPYPVRPQGSIQAFLAGLDEQELRQFVRRVDLSDPFFETLQLTAKVFGVDWAADPIDFVEAEFHYEGTDENGQAVEKATSAVFTKDKTEFEWDPSLIGAKREYEYRWRIGYRGHEPSAFSGWVPAMTNKLAFAVTKPGQVAVKFLAGDIDFATTTENVQIEVEYADEGAGVPKDGTVLALNPATAEQGYSRWIFQPQREPLRYRTRFALKNDQTVLGDWQEATLDQIFVNEPEIANRLDVTLVPTGSWDNVVQTVVSLRYRDPRNAIAVEGTFQLRKLDEHRTWVVFLQENSPRTFEYKVITTFADGSTDDGGGAWLKADGDQPLPIKVKQPPQLTVQVLPAVVDFTVTPVVEVSLRYAGNGTSASETFALTSKEDKPVWRVPLTDPAQKDFYCRITYNTADEVVEVPEKLEKDGTVTVPALKVPMVTCLLNPKNLDFVATPIVEVTVSYSDPAHQPPIAHEQTFLFSDTTPQEFRVRTGPNSPKTYDLTVRYFLADGTTTERGSVSLIQSNVTIPRPLKTPA
ncbi:hypothetical protein ACFQV2_20705 [Actinokineospora soli]|uniref:Ig-like domain-containing protein n=1 Tax=Actinokineospora soli TaxID=1048753 RepID=A0ABW2TRY4_9PSEU